tara:strand:+ start:97 stop:330 length:234 start_codon:yes stop_codon:yes gene_type:complete
MAIGKPIDLASFMKGNESAGYDVKRAERRYDNVSEGQSYAGKVVDFPHVNLSYARPVERRDNSELYGCDEYCSRRAA